MSAVGDACADLAQWLPVAGTLIGQPDDDGTRTSRAQPASHPPWNQAAAAAALGAAEGVHRLEASLRLAVTGHPGRRRHLRETGAAISAVVSLAYAVDPRGQRQAAAYVMRLVTVIRQLPAVDEDERWQRVRTSVCPYCRLGMLRFAPRSGRITCLRYGSCWDADGRHPMGLLSVSKLDAAPCVAWNDGLVT